MSDPVKINCRKCRARYDVSDLPPFTMFSCPECGTQLRTPKVFGRYLLEKLYGQGGMSGIYRAIDPVLMRRVIVKIAKSESEHGNMKERFQNEAKLLAPISHAAVIPIYDCGEVGDESFIVMQFMDGGDLETHMKKNSLPAPNELIDHLRNVASGLHYLYLGHNIVHHDVKPSNIMLASDGSARIGDFDLCDIRRAGDITTPCMLWGSPGYLSPERLQCGGEDHRGDIYSLGITIYELFSGQLPFGIHGEAEALYLRRQEPFTPLLQLCPEVGKEISQLVDGMLSFEVSSRPTYPEIIRSLHL